MKAPIGAVVKIYYDGAAFGRVVELDHVLRTPTGRLYLVIGLRRQARGAHVGRLHLQCMIIDEAPPDVTVHPLHWYRRQARRPRG